jgi:hypothetical protein
MASILKSNVAYMGATTLQTLDDLEVTAESYTERVENDGGRVVDSAHLDDTFDFLDSESISPRNFIIGASFGVREINGKIDKIYAFNGNDLVRNPTGQIVWYLDESGAFPVFKMDVVTGQQAVMRSQSTQYIMRPAHTSYVAGMSGVDMVSGDSNFTTLSCHPPGALGASMFSMQLFNNSASLDKQRFLIPNSTYNPASGAGGQTNRFDAGTPYADYAAISAYMDVGGDLVTTYENGVLIMGPTATDSAGFALTGGMFDPSATLVQFVLGGSVEATVLTANNKQKVAEAWVVSGGSTAFALALSERLDALYS